MNCCVTGLQWGDEGKGKVVDILAEKADIVVRYSGGANAGHTVIIGNKNDLKDKHEIKKDDITALAKKYKAVSFITSAKTGYNVEKMFYHLGEQLVKTCLSF